MGPLPLGDTSLIVYPMQELNLPHSIHKIAPHTSGAMGQARSYWFSTHCALWRYGRPPVSPADHRLVGLGQFKHRSPIWIRTRNLAVNSRLLSQLSYRGMKPGQASWLVCGTIRIPDQAVAQTGLEPAYVLIESQATLPIRLLRLIGGWSRSCTGPSVLGGRRTHSECLSSHVPAPGFEPGNLLRVIEMLYR